MQQFTVENISGTPGATTRAPVTGTAIDEPVRAWVVILFVAVVVAASLLVWALWDRGKPNYFVPRSDYTAVAALVLFATALERFLEPFSRWLLPDTTEQADAATAKDAATAQASDPAIGTDAVRTAATEAAGTLVTLARKKNERAIAHWAVATLLALVGAAIMGVFFLHVVAQDGQNSNTYLDLLLTGLIVGAGTKPVHDLITNIQAKQGSGSDTLNRGIQ